MNAEKTVTLSISRAPYYTAISGFLACLGLLMLAVVDIRRGFLFSPDYFKVGTPSVLLHLSAAQIPMLLAGIIGVWLAFRYMRRFESQSGNVMNFRIIAIALAAVIIVLFIVDLFIYRGVPASRTLDSGSMSPGTGIFGQSLAIPVGKMPAWLQPLGDGLNYLLVVWHATTLSILLGSLFLVAAGSGLVARLKGDGFGAHLVGAAMALPTPFCSCCAAPIGSALYRKGASLGPVLAFTVAAPMLNITSLVLAASLLPPQFAVLRILGGMFVAVFLTYFVSLILRWMSSKEPQTSNPQNERLVSWGTKLSNAYGRLFRFDKLLITETPESPATLIASWMKMAGRLAQVMIPIFLITAPLTAYIVRLMPEAADNMVGVAVASFFGTLLMSPTWSEIAFAGGMITRGFPALAATALVVLPAVSIPCLLIISGAVGKMRIAVVTGLFVFLAGIAAGAIFLK